MYSKQVSLFQNVLTFEKGREKGKSKVPQSRVLESQMSCKETHVAEGERRGLSGTREVRGRVMRSSL